MRVALAQINPVVGDVDANRDRAGAAIAEAARAGADLVVLPELCLTGYPPKDLLERPAFVARNLEARDRIAHETRGVAVILGFVERNPGAIGKPLWNAAAVIEDGRVASVHAKRLLPTYDVFDEERWFEPAVEVVPATIRGRRVGVTICEDVWTDPDLFARQLYPDDPPALLASAGIDLLVNVAASPFTLPKRSLRPRMLAAVARRLGVPLVFVNQVGGNDELLFDGHGLLLGADGGVRARAREFAEDLVVADLEAGGVVREHASDDASAAFDALVMGVRDYARKCGFVSAVVGVSGGIDSSLVAAVAAHALGAANVHLVALPSRFSSPASREDAEALALALGAPFRVASIEPMIEACLHATEGLFDLASAPPDDVTMQNVQARLRALVLMGLSNRFGHLLLSTGNKSEIAVGYCTLYGDMAGGLGVLADVPKGLVYRIAREANRRGGAIPERVFTRPPSAELRPDQTDQDTLPPYEVLDAVLEAYVERGEAPDAIAAAGVPHDVVDSVVGMIRRAEYKRRQMAPGLILTSKAFGPGRQMPVAQGWQG